MKHLVTVLLVLGTSTLHAQTWKLNIETGATLSKLMPTAGSTPASTSIRYAYSEPGMYIAPEVQLKINEHIDVGANYQYANIKMGIEHLSGNTRINNYDGIDMHNFNLGLYLHRAIFKGSVKVGTFVKSGFAYNKMVSMGSSSGGGDYGGGSSSSAPSYSSMNRKDDFDAVAGKWTPNSTIGLSIGTNSKKWIADRLSFRLAATMSWTNVYDHYSSYDYTIFTNNGFERGTVKYQGIPLVLQFGVNYRIAGFGAKD